MAVDEVEEELWVPTSSMQEQQPPTVYQHMSKFSNATLLTIRQCQCQFTYSAL